MISDLGRSQIFNFDDGTNSWLIHVLFKGMMLENINKAIKSTKAVQMQEARDASRTHTKSRRNIGTDTEDKKKKLKL